MNNTVTLTVTSLLTILFSSFHLADDVVKGIEPGGTSNYIGVMIMAVFLFARLMLAGRHWRTCWSWLARSAARTSPIST